MPYLSDGHALCFPDHQTRDQRQITPDQRGERDRDRDRDRERDPESGRGPGKGPLNPQAPSTGAGGYWELFGDLRELSRVI